MSRRRAGFASSALVACVAVALAGASGARAAGILQPGTQPADGSGDPAFPSFLDLTVPGTLDLPRTCVNCHSNYRSAGQVMFEMYDTWAGSMMSQASRDPLFWAALDVANQDDARLGTPGVGDLCLRCHVPRAWYEGRSHCTTTYGRQFDGACLLGPPAAGNNDFEGVLCALCHRMYDASQPPAGQFQDPLAPRDGNAQIYISNVERELRGPLFDSVPEGHTATGSALHLSAALCGQCHDVTNPAVHRKDAATGADLGFPMPIERTFREYQQSRMADAAAPEHATCQQCHMPEPDVNGDGVPDPADACDVSPGVRGETTALQGPIRQHVFAGGNTWMMGVLSGLYGAALGRTDDFTHDIDVARTLMTTRAVTLGVTAPTSATAGDVLAVAVRVTNLSGHKFPTGYPEGRRAWVDVAAGEDLDDDGTLSPAEVEMESGAYDPATGALTLDAQVKVYEEQVGVWNWNGTGLCDLDDAARGTPMFHFVLDDCVVRDDRIPPLGFAPDAETAPTGYTYPANAALPGTLANWDDTSYSVTVPVWTTHAFLIETRVRYQSTSRDYVDFLRAEDQSTCDPADGACDPTQPDARPNRAEKIHDLWEANGRAAPLDLAFVRTVIPVTPLPAAACCAGGSCTDFTPVECRALEGSYEGAGSACATTTCAPLGNPPGEAADVAHGHAPLLVTLDPATGALQVSFGAACDATDHAIAWGALSQLHAYATSGYACGFGTSGTATFDPGPGSTWLLAVGRTSVVEGSYGHDSLGRERPQRVGTTACDLPQDLTASCQ